MPIPGGVAAIAPIKGKAPGAAACGSMSQLASLTACQIPLRLGLPSAVRGALYAVVWLMAGARTIMRTAANTKIEATITFRTVRFLRKPVCYSTQALPQVYV